MKLMIKGEQEQTKKDLLSFLENEQIALKEKLNSQGQGAKSLSELLATMATWLEASKVPDTPTAEAFAKILYTTKYYE